MNQYQFTDSEIESMLEMLDAKTSGRSDFDSSFNGPEGVAAHFLHALPEAEFRLLTPYSTLNPNYFWRVIQSPGPILSEEITGHADVPGALDSLRKWVARVAA